MWLLKKIAKSRKFRTWGWRGLLTVAVVFAAEIAFVVAVKGFPADTPILGARNVHGHAMVPIIAAKHFFPRGLIPVWRLSTRYEAKEVTYGKWLFSFLMLKVFRLWPFQLLTASFALIAYRATSSRVLGLCTILALVSYVCTFVALWFWVLLPLWQLLRWIWAVRF